MVAVPAELSRGVAVSSVGDDRARAGAVLAAATPAAAVGGSCRGGLGDSHRRAGLRLCLDGFSDGRAGLGRGGDGRGDGRRGLDLGLDGLLPVVPGGTDECARDQQGRAADPHEHALMERPAVRRAW